MRRGLMLLGPFLILASPSVGFVDFFSPDTPAITVVRIKTEDSDAQADALTTALQAEVRNLAGWSLAEGDYSLEVLTMALRCPWPPDAACEARIAQEIKADRYIWGTIDEKSGKAVGTLHLWQRDQGQTKVDLSYASNLTEANDETLRQIVREALATLTGGPPKGSVDIRAGDVNGQVLVDGKPVGTIQNGKATIFVPAGTRRIEVRAPGYAPVSGDVTVHPNGSVSLTLHPVAQENADSSEGPNYRRIGAYSALVAGGALAIGGVYSSLQVNSINNDNAFIAYREGVEGDVCEAAKNGVYSGKAGAASPQTVEDKCAASDKFSVLQWVFYGLSAVSVGAGTYLLVTEKPDEKGPSTANQLQVLPTAVRGGGGLDLRLKF